MKVLFVSGKKTHGAGQVVLNQGESLKAAGVTIDYFLIKPGLMGYLSAIPIIRRTFKKGRYDLVHAHYGLSAVAASLAGRFPLVVSLMGSDVYMYRALRMVIRYLSRCRWNLTIVKTQEMKKLLGLKDVTVIPNGVDMDRFRPMDEDEARKHTGYPENMKKVLFISAPGRREKNYELAEKAMGLLNEPDTELKVLIDIANQDIPYYLNSADVLLLTSKWEGSPNVIKEAMACNCPVVSTDTGDARWILGDTAGCFLSSFDPADVAGKIGLALRFGARTNGRGRIFELGLDSVSVAQKVKSLYERILS
jgi:teichuronic acid biosynthesis glycosyltransferase TuaC